MRICQQRARRAPVSGLRSRLLTPVPDRDPRYVRLGAIVKRVRKQQGWRRGIDFANDLGLSTRWLTALETGARTNFAPESLDQLEIVLGWGPGTIAAVLEGRELPDPPIDLMNVRVGELWHHFSDTTKADVRAAARERQRGRR